MTSPIEKVNPGDLITSQLFNHVADHVNDLLQRVATLETLVQPGTRVTLVPFIGSVHIGDEITVQGTNFEVPARFNQVTMDGNLITQFNPGTDDSHLVFNVPGTILGTPKDVIFSVTNQNGDASITITVLPASAAVPVGELRISPVPTNQGQIQVAEVYTFPFIMDSQTGVISETYLLDVVYTSVVGATRDEWIINTEIQNLTGQAITNVTITPGSPVTVNVLVRIPDGATSVNLALQAFSVHSPSDPLLNPTSTAVPIQVGQATQVSDPRTTFGQLIVSPTDRLVADPLLGQTIQSPLDAQTLVRVTAEFSVPGTYNYSARVLPPTSPPIWVAAVLLPNPPSTPETAGSQQDIAVQLTAPSNPDPLPTRTLEIHAARTGAGENFDSWFSIPILIV